MQRSLDGKTYKIIANYLTKTFAGNQPDSLFKKKLNNHFPKAF